ncbi:glucose-6-phosphate dehydrogenase [Thiopseudomonas alkaliphila]|uniref:glucose-6-phosphate dehydrogenase n=1 Tax=Thiopseudomonas alkaliphila TaxID=1697053 RepID=UPI00069F56A6|nr:glucose-6-phosphate dehydrogenase [Thiopseudomonas alkaliphila]AKX48808.1 glucose-6-phosphate dehydrogenase [Thiopseudomonas alkaliphila]
MNQQLLIYVFGGTGDLALSKLIPALYVLFKDRCLPEQMQIVGISRKKMSDAEYRQLTEKSCRSFEGQAFDVASWQQFNRHLAYLSLDASHAAEYAKLKAHLLQQAPNAAERTVIYYLATAPQLFASIANHIGTIGLAEANARIVIEKPLGHSLASALAINQQIGQSFAEENIYRIDHYLGKETVQNLMALRFANALFEPVWRAAHIDHVQISVLETVGIGSRGEYYDQAGAMRDMLQNHLLQLLCLIAMEAPMRFDAEAVRNEKVKVLQALKPITSASVQEKTVRGQYTAGTVNGESVAAYYFEKNVNNDSDTETFVALEAEIDNWRWAGVPFYLRTGKRLAQKTSEIVIQFKPVPHYLFNNNAVNRLIIRLQPEERITLELMAKIPGKGMNLQPVALDIDLANAFKTTRRWDAYERLLLDVIEADSTLFMRRDEVEAAWQWVDGILRAWKANAKQPKAYAAGSDGPEDARQMLAHQGRQWFKAPAK